MSFRLSTALLSCLLLPHGCSGPGSTQAQRLQRKATGSSPEVLALYEAWWGHPKHINIGYSSQDPAELTKQIKQAQSIGISGFVVDWYGDREPFIDRSYATMQTLAAKKKFKIAMMYDETDQDEGSTDLAIADLTMFHDTYLSSKGSGHQAYLTYEGRPVIFVFPKGGHTDWEKVREVVNKWDVPPLLINENLPGAHPNAFDGYYAWVNPGSKGWSPDGTNWGEQYLTDFYGTMLAKYSDKIVVGGAWATFDDSKASWGANRHMAARCGQTFTDTFNFWHKVFPPDTPPPFVMVETWNDHEEGTAVEDGIPGCGPGSQKQPLPALMAESSVVQKKP